MASTDISSRTTHDLWVESRLFRLELSRPSPTTVELSINHPLALSIVDGYVVLLGTTAFSSSSYPADGEQYAASTDLLAPADRLPSGTGAQVVAFFSNALSQPIPNVGEIDPITQRITTKIIVTNANPDQLYYAAVYPATNVLQYYPLGVQSYALDGAQVDKHDSTYTGNIPTLPSAPTDPTPGMVYHDQQLNLIQYWTGEVWIPTRGDSILTGPVHPGVAGQAYIYNASQLKVFDGRRWVTADSSNLQLRSGTGWTPLLRVSANIHLPRDPKLGEFVWNYTTQRAQYWDGLDWVHPSSSNTLFNAPTGLIPACITPIVLEPVELPNPWLGQLFYNTTTKTLDAWTGTAWQQANTEQSGVSSVEKHHVGTDGSYDERVRVMNILKSQLGWPQACLELREEQLNIAIESALDNYRQLSDGAYRMQYVMFPLIAGQQTYYLNSAVDGTDRIVDVAKIHRLNVMGLQAAAGPDAIWTSGIINSFYTAGTVDILSAHLYASMSNEFQRIFASDLTFLWDEPSRELLITRKVHSYEKVILECFMERTEQELLSDRWCKQFIQNWALAEAKMTLGLIRSRFTSGTPGAAGTITQNGEMLVSEARQDFAELKEELTNFEYGGHVGKGNVSFLIG